MQLINILILWITLGLILVSISGKKQPKEVKPEKVKTHRSIFHFKKHAKVENEPQVNEQTQSNEQPQNNEQTETITATSSETQPSSPTTNPVPEVKKADVYIADLNDKNKDIENTKQDGEDIQNPTSQEPVVEPIEEAVEQIENGGDGEDEGYNEGIVTTTEVEDDEPFINIGVETNVFEKFFPKDDSQVPIYTAEFDSEEINGEYNSFSTSEEPWYEHPSVRKLIENNNDILEKEPKKFEIIERSY
jgi:hypothetical protein